MAKRLLYFTGFKSAFDPPFQPWANRFKITQLAAQADGVQTGFPLFFNPADIPAIHPFWANVKTDGGDIRFTLSDGTTLIPFEVVGIDTVAKTGEIHFKGDISDLTNTDFYLYYKNAAANLLPANDTYGQYNVWDSNYYRVYHFNGDPASGVLDSTVNQLSGTANNMGSGNVVAGLGGNAYSFNGTDENIDLTRIIPNGGSAVTIELFFKTADNSLEYMVQNLDVGANAHVLSLHKEPGLLEAYVSTSGMEQLYLDYIVSYNDNNWHQYAQTYDGLNHKIIFDGAVGASMAKTGSIVSMNNACKIGSTKAPSLLYTGLLDEVRVSIIARSESWLKTQDNNFRDSANFYTIGNEETP